MSNLKLLKKIFMEAFQWAAFATPLFVTGQRMALRNCPGEKCTDDTNYWLTITAIISYVAGITLLVWLPVKIFIVWKKVFRPYYGLWFPGNLLYIIFSAVPCIVFIFLAQDACDVFTNTSNANDTKVVECYDYFRGAPLETLVIMLVVTDWSEKIRYIKLRSSDDSTRKNRYTSAPWDKHGGSTLGNGDIPDSSRRSSLTQSSLLHPSVRQGSFMKRMGRSLKWVDARPENLLRDLMQAYDARILLEMTTFRVNNDQTPIFETDWLYAIYILAVISFLPFVLAPNSDMRSSFTVMLQDIPFFCLRIALYSSFGSDLVLQTSVLYLLKNFFVSVSFIHFNVIVPRWNEKKRGREYDFAASNNNNVTVVDNSNFNNSNNLMPDGDYDLRHPDDILTGMGIQNQAYNMGMRSSQYSRVTRHDSRLYGNFDNAYPEENNQNEVELENYPTMQYASQHQATRVEPQLATFQNGVQLEYVGQTNTANYDPEIRFDDDVDDDEFQADQVEETEIVPPIVNASSTAEKPQKLEIDYDTLHNPKSFLYSQERPMAQTLSFESSASVKKTKEEKKQDPVRESTKRQESKKEEKIEEIKTEIPATPVVTSVPSEENPYATIDKTRKTTRRKAPPPPKKPKKSSLVASQQTSDDLPPPPPEMMKNITEDEQDFSKMNGENQSNGESNSGMDKELAHRLAQEAMSAMDEAVKYGSKIGVDWSRNTTPRSTFNTKMTPSLSVAPNEEEFDIRL